MGEQTTFPFLKLPDVVIRDTLLPLLSLNTVLRLRLVSKAVNDIADNYLRIKVPSNKAIIIFDDRKVKEFVRKDETSSIRYPASKLCLNIYLKQDENPDRYFQRMLSYPEINYLATQYSAQIRSLEIECLKLPVRHDSPEFRFFQEFVNLKSLFVSRMYGPSENDDDVSASTLPSPLRNLNSFGFYSYYTIDSDQDYVWKFITKMVKLENFRFPQATVLKDQSIPAAEKVGDDSSLIIPAVAMLPKFTELIKFGRNQYLKVVTLNLVQSSAYTRETNAATQMELKTNLVNFVKVCEQFKIKWKKVYVSLLQILDKPQLDQIAPFVLSIDHFKIDDLKGAVFPNLYSLCTWDIFEPVRSGALSLSMALERMAAVFPNLKKLHMKTMSNKEDNQFLAQLWGHFPFLEDLTFGYRCICHLSNEAFFGREYYPSGKRQSLPCFLKLKALKKLEIYLDEETLCITDAVFYDVFRHMKLKEFQIHSTSPLKSISKYGIMALLTGPFVEANERFPFTDFKLMDMGNEELYWLGREFPANQIF